MWIDADRGFFTFPGHVLNERGEERRAKEGVPVFTQYCIHTRQLARVSAICDIHITLHGRCA
jgi:hypothetical protein